MYVAGICRTALVLLLAGAAASARTPQSPPGQAAQPAPAPTAQTPNAVRSAAAVPVRPVTMRIVARYPHDPSAFTQGLIWHDGHLYESTGQPGASEVRRVRLSDGEVLARRRIPADQFGEGLALVGDELVSLTWQHGTAYRWNVRTLKPVGTARYTGEGWGLAQDGERLILSDGTPALRFLDARTLEPMGQVTITANGRPLRDVNELEMIDGRLWANVWHRNYIVRIDTATGQVDALADLSPLRAELGDLDPESVLNGIAWDATNRRLFVTGKYWPTLFEIALEE